MPGSVDLTPFGFTATESQAYGALLRLGPSTGYAVAHAARIARANTYGALEGLAGRAAAIRLPGRPVRYRAVDPRALIAQLAAEQGHFGDSFDQLIVRHRRTRLSARAALPSVVSPPPAARTVLC